VITRRVRPPCTSAAYAGKRAPKSEDPPCLPFPVPPRHALGLPSQRSRHPWPERLAGLWAMRLSILTSCRRTFVYLTILKRSSWSTTSPPRQAHLWQARSTPGSCPRGHDSLCPVGGLAALLTYHLQEPDADRYAGTASGCTRWSGLLLAGFSSATLLTGLVRSSTGDLPRGIRTCRPGCAAGRYRSVHPGDGVRRDQSFGGAGPQTQYREHRAGRVGAGGVLLGARSNPLCRRLACSSSMEQASRLHNDKSRRAACTTGNDCHEDAPGNENTWGAFVELVESLTDEATRTNSLGSAVLSAE